MGRRSGPRSFDPVVLGNREADAWSAYYRREWRRVLVAAVGMVSTGFGMGPVKALIGAFHVLRANQLWAPYPDNDPDGARSSMRRFYALVAADHGLDLDPVRAAELEVEWWRLHREHQHDPDVPERALSPRWSTSTPTCTPRRRTRCATRPAFGSRRWTSPTCGSRQVVGPTTRFWPPNGVPWLPRTQPCARRSPATDARLFGPRGRVRKDFRP